MIFPLSLHFQDPNFSSMASSSTSSATAAVNIVAAVGDRATGATAVPLRSGSAAGAAASLLSHRGKWFFLYVYTFACM